MTYMIKHLKLFLLLGCMLSAAVLQAAPSDKLLRLEAEMLKYIGTSERDTFYVITEQLKETAKNEGEELLFYKAWSNQAMYEATHRNIGRAHDIVKALANYAETEHSVPGRYYALHSNAFVLQQENKFAEAEEVYLKALAVRHQYWPKESAAEDLRELMRMAYLRNDRERARKYAYQLLAEPNLAPHHKGRTLNRLSVMAFDENDVEEFNHIYEEMKRLSQTDGIRVLSLYTEVNWNIINGDFKQALRLADWLSPDSCAERKAVIYHRMGDNERAYDYMAQYKHISDSIKQASHDNVVSNLYLRMNNDRLRLQQEVLYNKNNELRHRFYYAVGAFLILALLFLVYQRHRSIKLLKKDNQLLNYGKEGAERALEELNELSFYESKTELPLDNSVKVNKLCNLLTDLTQENCYRGVTVVFETELDDDFEIKTNANALEKLISHLLNYSARFTYKGSVTLKCINSGEFVRFSVTDTSEGMGSKPRQNLTSIFAGEGNQVRYVGMNFGICQSITRLLHGRIWHDVGYKHGTRFCFEIPKES